MLFGVYKIPRLHDFVTPESFLNSFYYIHLLKFYLTKTFYTIHRSKSNDFFLIAISHKFTFSFMIKKHFFLDIILNLIQTLYEC